MSRFRVELLKTAKREKGWCGFLHEAWLIARSLGPHAYYLIFEITDKEAQSLQEMDRALDVQDYKNWQDIPPEIQQQLQQEKSAFWWNIHEWFSYGRRMWIGTVDRRVAIMSWTLDTPRQNEFFFPIAQDWSLIWKTATVHEFRGRGLYPAMLRTITRQLAKEGNKKMFIHCGDFNSASEKGIRRAGFRRVGRGILHKKSRKHIWYPDLEEKNL